MKQTLSVSERRACAAPGHHRSTQRRPQRTPEDETTLAADIVELARTYGRYGYRRINALLRATVAVADYQVLAGEPQIRRSSDIGERWFCSKCGTPLAMRVDHQRDTIDFTIPPLDDPSPVVPTFHIWVGSRIPWFNTTDACARHDRFRPVTAGLKDGDVEAERI